MNATIRTPEDLLAKLAEPFPPSAITWKPGSLTRDGNKCLAMAYADLRAYQDRLDAVCGLDWSLEYQPWGDTRIIARLTIGGVTRSSTGEMDGQDQKNGMGGTVAEAQAAKRAAAMFGLGRYLYELPSVWVEYDAAAKRISKAGEAELNRRYLEWYARKVAHSRATGGTAAGRVNGKVGAPAEQDDDTARAQGAPADLEHDLVTTWTKPDDAYAWAMSIGASDSVRNARRAFANVVTAHGAGAPRARLTKQNAQAIYLAYIRACQAKLHPEGARLSAPPAMAPA